MNGVAYDAYCDGTYYGRCYTECAMVQTMMAALLLIEERQICCPYEDGNEQCMLHEQLFATTLAVIGR